MTTMNKVILQCIKNIISIFVEDHTLKFYLLDIIIFFFFESKKIIWENIVINYYNNAVITKRINKKKRIRIVMQNVRFHK